MGRTMGREDSKGGRGGGSSSRGKGRGGGGGRGDRGGRGRGGGGGRGHHKGKPTNSFPKRHKKVEVTFNPTDRHEYLTGFSTRKKERRAFGLAMQKVKDRRDKLEERKEQREANLEKIEDIERNKKALRKGMSGDNSDDDDDDDDNSQHEPQHNDQEMKTFQDEETTQQFGGLVSVTTTFGIPSDDEDDEKADSEFYARTKHGAGHIDEAQKAAGDVTKYIPKVKGTMGIKKKDSGGYKHKKGQHGATAMKGMGNATTLKMSKKILGKFKAKGGKGGEREERGGKGKKTGAKDRRGRR